MTTGQAGQVEAMSYQCGGSFNKLEQVPALPPSKIIKKSSSSTSLYKCMQMWLWFKNKGLERLALCISQPQGGQNQVLRKTWSLLLIRNSDSESTFSTTLLRVVKYPFFSWQNIQMQETIKTSAFQDCFRGDSCFEIIFFFWFKKVSKICLICHFGIGLLLDEYAVKLNCICLNKIQRALGRQKIDKSFLQTTKDDFPKKHPFL